jgi:hypothetical protein
MPQLCPLPIFLSHILIGPRAPNSVREIAIVYYKLFHTKSMYFCLSS